MAMNARFDNVRSEAVLITALTDAVVKVYAARLTSV